MSRKLIYRMYRNCFTARCDLVYCFLDEAYSVNVSVLLLCDGLFVCVCGVVLWCGVAWRGAVRCGVVWGGVVWCGVVWGGVVWCVCVC